ncbi:endolytic transglycosylase MltG [Aliarcobacter butzleri]|uniref:Endolytic murein transglycosylase n=1 Tax=Aliarcobacter butzleri TaxID=28197 RepID=A0AAW6VHS0_9BACT|nr:endolytic transglycosylase MltG [Aliarcobacter butzleri]MDK2041536.1 endolytic transglycosylase MltG [Aliarcobacter butzleri]MDK2096766.1 endolytic transglycosylase MltG [Aliarcobacter butzleri]
MPIYRDENIKNIKRNDTNIAILMFFNIIDFILIGLIVVLFYLTMPVNSTKVLFIPKGSTSNIISHLNKSGYEMNALDEIIIKMTGYIQSGWIDIDQTRLTKMDFIYKLISSKAALKTITLIPGETSYFFLKKIAQEFSLSEETLTKIYNEHAYKADGNILADTYSIPIGMKEDYIIFYLFSQTNRKYEEFSKKIFGVYDKKKWYNYIILASVIQKEAATTNEMPIVASVVHNRLKKSMRLQMDGTLNYGKYSNSVVTADRIREDTSSYNTYLNAGLPKDPICAVSLDSIKAAIFPVKSNYLYFVRDNRTGLHKFASTFEEHQVNIQANVGVAKTYTKVKAIETQIDEEAQNIMKTDISNQKPTSIKDLFNNIN